MNITLKRLVAFFIDAFVIATLSLIITNISYVNPTKEKYNEYLDRYLDSLKSEKEAKEELEEINYELNKSGIYENSITMVITVLYFGLLPFYNKGQTLGKKAMKIRIVDIDNNEISPTRYFVRIVVLRNTLFMIINYVLLYTLSKSMYYNIATYLSMIESSISIIIVFMILFRTDNRGLHELITKTKVVDITKTEEEKLKEYNTI